MHCDVSSDADVERLGATALREMGHVDIVMNNAGVVLRGALEQISVADWEWSFGINVLGVVRGIRAFLPHMLERGSGHIINTASILALTGDPFLPAYTAMKTGVLGLTRAVAVDYAIDGIRCNCVCPGDMETPMIEKYFKATADPVAARKEMEDAYPGKRIAHPREVAQAVLFLASDEASFVSGTYILVDGGLTAKTY